MLKILNENKCSKCCRESCLDKLGYDDNRCALELCGADHNWSVNFNLCIECIEYLMQKDPQSTECLYSLLKEWADRIRKENG